MELAEEEEEEEGLTSRATLRVLKLRFSTVETLDPSLRTPLPDGSYAMTGPTVILALFDVLDMTRLVSMDEDEVILSLWPIAPRASAPGVTIPLSSASRGGPLPVQPLFQVRRRMLRVFPESSFLLIVMVVATSSRTGNYHAIQKFENYVDSMAFHRVPSWPEMLIVRMSREPSLRDKVVEALVYEAVTSRWRLRCTHGVYWIVSQEDSCEAPLVEGQRQALPPLQVQGIDWSLLDRVSPLIGDYRDSVLPLSIRRVGAVGSDSDQALLKRAVCTGFWVSGIPHLAVKLDAEATRLLDALNTIFPVALPALGGLRLDPSTIITYTPMSLRQDAFSEFLRLTLERAYRLNYYGSVRDSDRVQVATPQQSHTPIYASVYT